MSIKAMTWAWQQNVSATQKIILLALGDHADDSGTCWASFEHLSKKSSLTRRSVIQQIDHLEKINLVTKKGKTQRGVNLYSLNLHEIYHFPSEPHSPADSTASELHSPRASELDSPENNELVNDVHQGSECRSLELVNVVHLASERRSPNTSINHPLTVNEPSLEVYKEHKPLLSMEDKNLPSTSVEEIEKIDNCPHQKIIELYHKKLSMCRRVLTWTKTRQDHLRARWKEYPDLELWNQFFDIVAKSKFLTGKVTPREGRKLFVASLDWLIKPENFAKVLEEFYQ
jgi:hypothetical protein